jgi:hypothetical protein
MPPYPSFLTRPKTLPSVGQPLRPCDARFTLSSTTDDMPTVAFAQNEKSVILP